MSPTYRKNRLLKRDDKTCSTLAIKQICDFEQRFPGSSFDINLHFKITILERKQINGPIIIRKQPHERPVRNQFPIAMMSTQMQLQFYDKRPSLSVEDPCTFPFVCLK